MALTVMHKKEAHDVSQNIKKMDDHWFIIPAFNIFYELFCKGFSTSHNLETLD